MTPALRAVCEPVTVSPKEIEMMISKKLEESISAVTPVVEPKDLATQLADQRRKVDFDSYDITVQQLLKMVEDGAIDIAPVYQRQYRWDPLRQCKFIESIFLGIPIPSLFMATNADGTWELVDGV